MPGADEAILWALLLIYPAILIAAAAGDIARYEIPNSLSIVLLAAFPVAALVTGWPAATLAWHGLGGLLMLAIGFVLFVRNLLGGGDVKLMAAAAVWTGFGQLPAFIVASALAGGLVAIIFVVARLVRHRRIDTGAGIPYGTAIALGGLMVFPRLPLVAPLIG